MLLTVLARAIGGFRHAHPFRALTPAAYRTLFYPSAPLPSLHSTSGAKFPPEIRAHLSEGQFSSVRNSGATQSLPKAYFDGIIETTAPRTGATTPAEIWEQNSARFGDRQAHCPGVHAGRTVEIRKDDNVGQAYARLQAILRNNNVRKELRLTERHEKKGAKRRRLRSERWRRKFADEVRKKVKLVTEIRLRDRMWGARH